MYYGLLSTYQSKGIYSFRKLKLPFFAYTNCESCFCTVINEKKINGNWALESRRKNMLYQIV